MLRELVGITVVEPKDLKSLKELADTCMADEVILPVFLPGGRYGSLHIKKSYLAKI